jgi:uncharacterized protein with HEPN domain
MRSDHDRLLDIQEAIERIEKYAVHGRETLAKDELVQTWIVHHLPALKHHIERILKESIE